MKRIKLFQTIIILTAMFFTVCSALSSCQKEEFPSVADEPLALSAEGGVYREGFSLYVSAADASDKIYYTTDGSKPTTDSALYCASEGIEISDVSASSEYKLTNAVLTSGYGDYTYGAFSAGVVLRLLETDSEGETVAEKTATYIVAEESLYRTLSSHPVICLTAERTDWIGAKGIYNNQWNDELSIRAEMEYYDPTTGERFSLNTKVSIGGGWTRGYPQRTLNLNFKRDENGNKNKGISADIFGDRQRRDGSGRLGKITKIRLHNGGNGIGGAWFSDAFVQTLCDGLSASTTAYRPCSVYLNGEFWGAYMMREHYSKEYFSDNYGVDDDDVVYVDRRADAADMITIGGKSYKTYGFIVKEYDEVSAYEMIDELFSFLLSSDLSEEENYRKFESMVDVESFLDSVLVSGYVCNWDYMYNNLRMWRTASVDESNPYADGRWRFCLHDEDFSFLESYGTGGISEEDWEAGRNYFDFYVGNAYMIYSNVGYIPEEEHCILSAPLKNASFRKKMLEKAYEMTEVFAYDNASLVMGEMQSDVNALYSLNIRRWNMEGYTKATWIDSIDVMLANLQARPRIFISELKASYGL